MNLTVADPESHEHLSFVDVVTMPLNMADAVRTLIFVHRTQVHDTVNRQGSGTFSTVESEVPAFATICGAMDSKSTSPGHMKSCVREVLGKHTVLHIRN